jgi:hypothetical protein
MDPISVGLLAAVASGAGGEMGKQAWAKLSALVHKPFQKGDTFSSGEAELALLGQTPNDVARAQALSTALAVRAALDGEFGAELDTWRTADAMPLLEKPRVRDVYNKITGGTFEGMVIQAGNIEGGLTNSAG